MIQLADNEADSWTYLWSDSFVYKQTYASVVGWTQAPR
jgi:hypothetical protein